MSYVQNSYAQTPAYGVAGMLSHHSGVGNAIETGVSAETVYPGRIVEISTTTGKCRPPQGTAFPASGHKVFGLVLRDETRENNADGTVKGYAAGEPFPVLRRGVAWAELSGGTPVLETVINVKHASDDTASNAEHRGKLSQSATSATAGAEITATALIAKQHSPGVAPSPASGIVLVEINSP
jgi:hypothetical protein